MLFFTIFFIHNYAFLSLNLDILIKMFVLSNERIVDK